jgi:hypothetical protein
MTWEDPTTKVEAARDRLLECPSIVGMGLTDAGMHYPDADPGGEDDLPLVVLEESPQYEVERHAPGETYARGSVMATLYFPADEWTVGALERLGRALAHEVVELTTPGLFITGATATLSSRPTRAQEAVADDDADPAPAWVSLVLTMRWEG